MSSNIHSTHIDAPIRCLRHFHSRVVAFFGEFVEKVSDETWAVFAATQLKHTPNIASKLMKYRFDVGNLHNKLIIYILNNACEFSWNWCSLQSSAFCSFAWEMGEVYAVLCNIFAFYHVDYILVLRIHLNDSFSLYYFILWALKHFHWNVRHTGKISFTSIHNLIRRLIGFFILSNDIISKVWS